MKFKKPEEYVEQALPPVAEPAQTEPVAIPAPTILTEAEVRKIVNEAIESLVNGQDALLRLRDHIRSRLSQHGSIPTTWQSLDKIISDCVDAKPPEEAFVRPAKPRIVYDIADVCGTKPGEFCKMHGAYHGGTGASAKGFVHYGDGRGSQEK
jgi:hypothetical protein